ncbi:hypothetical protein BVX95_00660 [archaeon D22]|nr:hypothetical protein BVX95_00660 [archaeon D22]
MKIFNLLLNTVSTKFRKYTLKQADILFLGDPNYIKKLHNKKIASEYFEPIQDELTKSKISHNEIIFPGHKMSDIKKLNSKQVPLEYLITGQDFFKFSSLDKKEFKAYLSLFQYSKIHKYTLNFFYNLGKKILSRIKPKIIILACSYTLKYSWVLAAKELGITTIEVQHGNINSDSKGYFKKGNKNYQAPDYFISFSDTDKMTLLKDGIFTSNQIVSLGSPRYDFLNSYNKRIDVSRYGIQNKKIIFWPTQPIRFLNGEGEKIINCVFKSLPKLTGYHLIIKMHPKETDLDQQFYKKIAKIHNAQNFTLLSHDDELTYDCISTSSVVILKNTTVGIESILMGKPVINFNISKGLPLTPFNDLKSKLLAKNSSQLEAAIKLSQKNSYKKVFLEERFKFINKYFTNLGNSSEKIVMFIEEKLNKLNQ